MPLRREPPFFAPDFDMLDALLRERLELFAPLRFMPLLPLRLLELLLELLLPPLLELLLALLLALFRPLLLALLLPLRPELLLALPRLAAPFFAPPRFEIAGPRRVLFFPALRFVPRPDFFVAIAASPRRK